MPSTSRPAADATAATDHWQQVYRTRDAAQVSWYRPHLERSLAWITAAAPARDARLLDVGGGASTLIDDLLAQGYRRVAVLDLSAAALDIARERLGSAAGDVDWRCGDVRTVALEPAAFDVWHDRAVFHFLTAAEDRAAYRRQVEHALKPGGQLVIATFALDGPERCSGLPVVRYDAAGLRQVFGDGFRLLEQAEERHETPGGNLQPFTWCRFRRL